MGEVVTHPLFHFTPIIVLARIFYLYIKFVYFLFSLVQHQKIISGQCTTFVDVQVCLSSDMNIQFKCTSKIVHFNILLIFYDTDNIYLTIYNLHWSNKIHKPYHKRSFRSLSLVDLKLCTSETSEILASTSFDTCL